MRLFAAFDPPGEARAALAETLGEDHDGRLRWVPAEQWHVTLAFYGDVAESRVEPLLAGLGRAAERSRPLSLRLAGAGTFPRRASVTRVVWMGLDGDVDAARRLADRCAGAGRRARIAMEERKFRPHLTLARARGGAVDATALVAPWAAYAGPWWTVTSFRLVHSHLGAQVRHDTLAEFPLAGGGTVHQA